MARKNKANTIRVPLTPSMAIWKVIKTIIYIFMVFCALSFAGSLIWVLYNSFKTAPDYMADSFGLPKEFDWGNYGQILRNLEYKGHGLFAMLGNSMILVAWSTFMCISIPHMAAYTLARFDFKGKGLIQGAIYLSMVVPVIGAASSQMWFLQSTGLYDNFLGIFLLQSGGLGFGQIMLTSFYKGIAPAYAEAAYMDGASEWTVFTYIYYPQAKGITMILVIQNFIGVWNDFMTGYLYLPSHPTLALGLQQMQAQFVDYGNDYPVMFAGVILAMIPVLGLYLSFSENIMTGAAIGSLK